MDQENEQREEQIRNSQRVAIKHVDELLRNVELPEYSLLLRSVETASAIFLTDPRTRTGLSEVMTPKEAISLMDTNNMDTTDLTRRSDETFSDWAIRYVAYHLDNGRGA